MRRNILHRSLMGGSIEDDNIYQYLTIEAEEDGLTVSFPNDCYYCIDGNGEWIELPADTETPSISRSQKISFKASGLTPSSSTGIGTFTVSHQFNLSGSCMSMIYGDDFLSNQDSLSGYSYAFRNLFSNSPVVRVSSDFLPATNLSAYCYVGMFSRCSYLENTPSLDATSLTAYCYEGMFANCSSLREVCALPATTLHISCYEFMFANCTSLVSAQSILPAITLYPYCYASMFAGCSSLTQAPILPAPALEDYCYYLMFAGCSSLQYIKALFKALGSAGTLDWVTGVSSSGIFVKASDATWNETGVNGVPTGWTVTTIGGQYLAIHCLSSEGLSFRLAPQILEYSTDEETWTTLNGGWSPVFPANTVVYLRAEAQTSYPIGGGLPSIGYFEFSEGSKCSLSGNCMSLIYGDNANNETAVGSYYFNNLFRWTGDVIISVSEDFLPATYIGSYAYYHMFDGCTSLITAPNLPSPTAGTSGYGYMFYGCTSLIRPPQSIQDVVANMANYVCEYMFYGCTSLTYTPYIYTNTLYNHCFSHMFEGCTNLEDASNIEFFAVSENSCEYMFCGCTALLNAPYLYPEVLAESCYSHMFDGCRYLEYIEMYAIDITADNCLDNWVNGVADYGTFVKASDATWDVTGVSGVPAGWDIVYA